MSTESTLAPDRLAQLADRLELTDLIATLSRAIDRSDRDLVAACYAEDSFDDHGGFKGTGAEFADYICGGSPISRTAKSLLHILGQSLFDIDGDEAFVETAYTFDMVTAADELFHSSGRYVDYFRRIDGRWLLVYRRVVNDLGGALITTTSPSPAGQVHSARDRTDPVYDRRTAP